MGFKEYPINFLLAGLFIVALMSFGVSMYSNYGQDASDITGGQIDLVRLQEQVNKTSTDTESWGEAFRSDNPFVALGSIILFSVWGVSRLMWNSVIALWSLISDLGSGILGIPQEVTGVILAIIIISMIFAIWRVIKAGE